VAFSLKDQFKKQQKSVKSRALKPPKLLHIIPLKTVEISDRKSPTFHLTQKITKKVQQISLSLSRRIKKNIQKLRDNREKLSTLCYARPQI
jgi:hypothetical protein